MSLTFLLCILYKGASYIILLFSCMIMHGTKISHHLQLNSTKTKYVPGFTQDHTNQFRRARTQTINDDMIETNTILIRLEKVRRWREKAQFLK